MREEIIMVPDYRGRDLEVKIETEIDLENWEKIYRTIYRACKGMTEVNILNTIRNFADREGFKII